MPAKSQKSKHLPSKKVARKFMKVGVHTESQKSKESKVKTIKESFTTDPKAWRRGIVSKIPDNRTMYFTGKQTSSDTATKVKVKRVKKRKKK